MGESLDGPKYAKPRGNYKKSLGLWNAIKIFATTKG